MNRARMSRHKTVLVGTSVLLGFATLHLLWLIFGWGGEASRVLLGNVLYLMPSLVAALVVLSVAFRHQSKARRGWLLIGLGLTTLSIGNSI